MVVITNFFDQNYHSLFLCFDIKQNWKSELTLIRMSVLANF